MAQTLDPLWLTETPRPCGCVLVLSRAGQGIRECSTHAAAREMYEALVRIGKGEGAFSRDPLTHATNVIEEHKEIARVTLAKIDGGTRG